MSLSAEERAELVVALRREHMQGFVQISTCNRTLWLTVARHPEWAGQLLQAQVQSRWTALLGADVSRPRPTLLTGLDAVLELMKVATGLRSFVMGERQVSGQVHRAFEAARRDEQSHPILNMLDTALGRAVRRVQRIEGYGVDGEGLQTVVEDRLRQELGEPDARRVRVLGAGEIGEAIRGRLVYQGWSPQLANRTPDLDRSIISLDSLRGEEDPAVALVVATGAKEPLWGVDDLSLSVRESRRSLLIVDVGSPSQVHPEVLKLSSVRLIDLDALLKGARTPVSDGIRGRADAEVDEATELYRRKLIRQSWSGAWRAHQEATDAIAREALPACLERHGLGANSEQRMRLEDDLRQLITRYGHVLLDAMARGVPDEQESGELDDGGAER
jgi:glutamyl-tRNA reductase